jgi:hypothetical protein
VGLLQPRQGPHHLPREKGPLDFLANTTLVILNEAKNPRIFSKRQGSSLRHKPSTCVILGHSHRPV